MKISDENNRQQQLNEILKELSSMNLDTTQFESKLDKLCTIYRDEFRHSYSDFFPLILEIGNEEKPYRLEFLSYNLEELRQQLDNIHYGINGDERSRYSGLYKNFVKLSDHINIEISRVEFYKQQSKQIEELSNTLDSVKDELVSAKYAVDTALDNAAEAETKIENA